MPDSIAIVRPAPAHEAAVRAYLDAHHASGGGHLHGCGGLTRYEGRYAGWLAYLDACSQPATTPDGLVPSTTFLGIRQSDGLVIGTIDVRHSIDHPYLRLYGGHIGYGVRADERRKGYASQMLSQALAFCRDTLALPRVMITCNRDNLASAATIRRAGGVLTAERVEPNEGVTLQEYWIGL